MKSLASALFSVSILLPITSLAGPIGTYYITDFINGTNGTIYAVKGNDTGSTPMKNPNESAIAVVGSEVHTTGLYSGYSGSSYTGVDALSLIQGTASYLGLTDARMGDGTNDGESWGNYNYGVTHSGAGASDIGRVYRFDADWGNKQLQFTLPNIPTQNLLWVGITHDRITNTLWLTNLMGLVTHFDMTGNILDSFFIAPTAPNRSMTALAMDTDHTLWMVGYLPSGSPLLFHYNTSGSLLGTENPGLAFINAYGGEIATTCVSDGVHLCPEPSSLALFGISSLAFFGRKRSRGRTAM